MNKKESDLLLSANQEESHSDAARDKKRLPLFYKIYFSALAAFAVLLIVGACSLNAWLANYNKSIPETVSARFFTENFENFNAENILALSGAKPSEFETEDDLRRYVQNMLTGAELSYTAISAGSEENVKKYIVKSGEFKVADFTLEKNADGIWAPASLTLHLPAAANADYRILDSSTLYLNGMKVSDAYMTERVPLENAACLPEDVPAPEWVTYSVRGLTKAPEALVTDRNGNHPTLTAAENGCFYEEILYDEPEKELVDRLTAAAKQYAKCMQNDASKASVLTYFEKGTDLYNSIRTAENMFVWDHSGYAFEDESIGEFFRYDENTVSVRIAFTHILKKAGSADYRDRTDITYFAHNVDGKYLIFAMHNN
ncbi:MAG: hypothetical protein ACI4RV_01280 [Eubacteriales bacterium]